MASAQTEVFRRSRKTFYYTNDPELHEISEQIQIGDNLMNLPYLKLSLFLSLLQKIYHSYDYLYEGRNFIVFSLA